MHRALLLKFAVLHLAICCAGAFVPQANTGTSRNAASTTVFSSFQQAVNVNELSPRNGYDFLNWATNNGILMENFQIQPLEDDSNWGVLSPQGGNAGGRALFVPNMVRMTTQSIQQQDFPNLQPLIQQRIMKKSKRFQNGDVELASHFYLFLKVLQEYQLGQNSPYFAYLDALPRKFNTAVNFSPKETDSLPPFVKFLSRRDQANWDLFVKCLHEAQTPTISEATKYDPIVTNWAFNVVFTRARASFDGQAEIIPMSDMLNHNSVPNVNVQHDAEGNVHVTFLRDVMPGEQLFKCYGHPTNPSRLLATYGFYDHSSPATYCKLFPSSEPSQELQALGFDTTTMVFYPESGAIAPAVWDVVLYLFLGKNDAAAQQQFFNAHNAGDENTKQQFHQFYLPQTITGLMNHVDKMGNNLLVSDQRVQQLEMNQKSDMFKYHNQFVTQTFLKVRQNLQQLQAQQQGAM